MKKSMLLSVLLAALMTSGALGAETTVAPATPAAPAGLPAKEQSAAPAGHSAMGQSSAPTKDDAQEEPPLVGKVVQTMNNGGYSYIYLEKANGTKIWVAVMQMPVTVGSQMSFRPGMEMRGFESKGLKRTFDTIVFSDGPLTAPFVDANAPDPKKEKGASPGSKGASSGKEKKISVPKATGANAITVAEAYSKSAKLNNKKITVSGKVVKVSIGIMQRNWIHIQDGTGSQPKGTHNLVCTSSDMADVGDVVTVTGTLAKDRDFGGGYRYDAIIEKATFKK